MNVRSLMVVLVFALVVDYVIGMALYSECSRSTCGPGATVVGGAAWAIVGAIAALIAFAITRALIRVVRH